MSILTKFRFFTPAHARLPSSMHPYWASKYTVTLAGDTRRYIVVLAYEENKDRLLALWPEAKQVDSQPTSGAYLFSTRYPCPAWFNKETARYPSFIEDEDADDHLR